MQYEQLLEFAKRYTEAWCSQDASSVAGFYAASGSLTVSDDAPAVGRGAIAEVAQSFMATFPDLCVVMDELVAKGERTEYHWTLTGTNSGPGGTGKSVRISGFEVWQIGPDGLIASSLGHFDGAEYRRQLESGASKP